MHAMVRWLLLLRRRNDIVLSTRKLTAFNALTSIFFGSDFAGFGIVTFRTPFNAWESPAINEKTRQRRANSLK
jgi:hypothetical protein